jgi:hypothetical protein
MVPGDEENRNDVSEDVLVTGQFVSRAIRWSSSPSTNTSGLLDQRRLIEILNVPVTRRCIESALKVS